MNAIEPYLSKFIIQPFPIQFNCNDYHIIVFFEGHHEYESIEAMIQERAHREPYIRAIITCHDKIQTDHINDRDIYNSMKAVNTKRKVVYTPIKYSHTKKLLKDHFTLAFTSYKGEEILMDFYPASKPSAKYAKLIDPLGHSSDTSLPVMHPEKSTLIGARSKIYIKGIQYKIPVKVHVPIFFTGLNGFFSELFSIGIIRAGSRHFTLLRSPVAIKKGEQWIYKIDADTVKYEIKRAEENYFNIESENEKAEFEVTESGAALKSLYVYSSCKNSQNAEFTIHFSPSVVILPLSANNKQRTKSDFSISINNYTLLITGVVESVENSGSINLLLKSSKPDWATKRNVSISVDRSDNNFIINTLICKNI